MTDPILKKAADLKRLADKVQSKKIDAHVDQVMKIILDACTPPKGKKQ